MTITHLFPNKAVKYATGQRLVVRVNTVVTFDVADYVQNLTRESTTYDWSWDWGDGKIDQGASPTQTHTYACPGRYTIVLQTNINDAVQTWSWQVDVVLATSQFEVDAQPAVPWVGAAQATFASGDQVRHVVVPLPNLCAVGIDVGATVGDWGTTGALAPTTAAFAKAIDVAATRWQNAYASGFGRMPMPRSPLEWGVWAHTAMDAVAVGVSDALLTTVADLELRWREALRDPGSGHLLKPMGAALSALVAGVSGISTLSRPGWTADAAYVGAGDRSVHAADVMRWLEYALREANDQTPVDSALTARWRRLAQLYLGHLPALDHDEAWAWEVAQAAIQTVYALYQDLGQANNTSNAQILVLANPRTGHVGLRLIDESAPMWAAWTVGPGGGVDDTPTLQDMVCERGNPAGSHVRCRGVGVFASSPATQAPWTWDMRRFESLLDVRLRAKDPVLTATTTGVSTLGDESGLAATRALLPDGAIRTYVEPSGSNLLAADVVRPGLPLDAFDWARGGLRPHAALQLWSRQRGGSLGSTYDMPVLTPMPRRE